MDPEIRTQIWSDLEGKVYQHHEGQERKDPPVEGVPFDSLARFSQAPDLRSQVKDEIARWRAEKSTSIRHWDTQKGKWEYHNVYKYWQDRAERFPLLSVIGQQVVVHCLKVT